MKDEIIYDCKWSNEIDSKFVSDFVYVFESVFKSTFSDAEFSRKYLKNIYGPSLLVVAYYQGNPCAARALWRNDLDGIEAYQPGDTCVLENCRGKGIFSEMTRKALSFVPSKAVIYNFPNHKSYSGYIKMGWRLYNDYRLKLYVSYKEFKSIHPQMMDDEYVEWYASGRKLESMKINGHYFLVAKASRRFCYRIIGEISHNISLLFPRRYTGLIFFMSPRITWYNKNFAANHLVTRSLDIEYIPTWKMDAL